MKNKPLKEVGDTIELARQFLQLEEEPENEEGEEREKTDSDTSQTAQPLSAAATFNNVTAGDEFTCIYYQTEKPIADFRGDLRVGNRGLNLFGDDRAFIRTRNRCPAA